MFIKLLSVFIISFSSYFINCKSLTDHHHIESDSLSNPAILASYNNATNEETLFKTENYATYYFKNLDNNFGVNIYGSCGYVAIGMLLSFWDTYWNDGIIDEVYDQNEACYENNDYINLDENQSPGIVPEPSNIYNVDFDTYLNNVFLYSNQYFQFKLMTIGQNYYSHDGNFAMTYSKYNSLLFGYLRDYKHYSFQTVTVDSSNNESTVRDSVISYIRQGIPVKLGIEGHAVVAYDYDETTDKIYCHFGWGSNTTHVTIEEMGYSHYYNYYAIIFHNQHSHSNNYYYENSSTSTYLCPCSTICVHDIQCEDMYLDLLPIFSWSRSLINERWFDNSDYYYNIQIRGADNTLLLSIYDITDNSYRLTFFEFQTIESYLSDSLLITVFLHTNGSPIADIYAGTLYSKSFLPAYRCLNKLHIKPDEWGFAPRYYFYDEGIKETQKVVNGITISTKRLRCGYIENMFVNLSPRRQNAGYAYLEFTFSQPIYSMMFGACLWSDSELLNGYALLQCQDEDGDWYTEMDLLNDITLNTKEDGVIRYTRIFDSGTQGIRFIAQSSATGDRNKGRLCLEDLVFCQYNDYFSNHYYITNY